jgi:hypothetical protein
MIYGIHIVAIIIVLKKKKLKLYYCTALTTISLASICFEYINANK